jgi:hypothetical protein
MNELDIKMGVKTEREVELEDNIKMFGRELHDKAQMTWDEIGALKDTAIDGGMGLLGGVLDVSMRAFWAGAGAVDVAANLVAPEGTASRKAVADIGNTYISAMDFTSNPVVAVMAAALVAKKLENKDGSISDMISRGVVLHEMGALPALVAERMAEEVYSGLPDYRKGRGGRVKIKGQKRSYKDVVRDMGIKAGRSISDRIEGPDGRAYISTGPLTYIPFVGDQIEFTEDGKGLWNLERGGFFDATPLDITMAPTELLDPTLYVTGGSSGLTRALGRPLSKLGVKRLAELTTRQELRYLRRIKLAQESGGEILEAAAKDLKVPTAKSFRQEAEAILVDEARHNLDLLAPRGQVRFMGMETGINIGGRKGKPTLLAQAAQAAKIERRFGDFRDVVLKGQNKIVDYTGTRSVVDKIGTLGRDAAAFFQKDVSKVPEWLTARAAAEGYAMQQMGYVGNRLAGLARMNKKEMKATMDILGDQMRETRPPGLTERMNKALDIADELDQKYRDLAQESVKGVHVDDLRVISTLTSLDGGNRLAADINKRIAVADARRAAAVQAAETRKLEIIEDYALREGRLPTRKELIDEGGELTKKQLRELGEVERTEVFFRNGDKALLPVTEQIASHLASTSMSKVKNHINALVKSGAKPTDLPDDLFRLYELRLAVKNAPHPDIQKEARRAWKKATKQWEKATKDRMRLLVAKGDHSALITPLKRKDLLAQIDIVNKTLPWRKRLRPVTNPLEHLDRRAQTALQKEANNTLMENVVRMSKDDDFARRNLEKHLIPVGVLEHSPRVDTQLVDRTVDEYIVREAAMVHKRPTGKPNIVRAMESLNTAEERQLFFRKWLVGNDVFRAGVAQAPGTLSKKIHHMMSYLADEDGLFKQVAKVPGMSADELAVMRRFNDEATALRKYLTSKGENIHDLFPRVNMTGMLAEDGTRFVPYYNLAYKNGAWQLTKDRTGEAIYIPESMARSLQRLGNAGVENPEVGKFLAAWDSATNGIKIALTAIGGFPSFQVRNAYSNVAFGLTGAGIHMLRNRNWALAEQLSRGAIDPRLAITGPAHRAGLDHRAMNFAVARGQFDRETMEQVVRESYLGGRKSAQKLVEDPFWVTKKADELAASLKKEVIRTDFGESISLADVMREIKLQGVEVDPRALAEFTGSVERFLSDPSRGQEARRWMMDKALSSNAYVEQFSRQQLFMTYIERGVGFEEAGKLVNRWMLDYQSLSGFEKSVMKRVMPFYTFYSKALPLMIRSLLERPGSVAFQAHLLSTGNDPVLTFGSDEGERIVLKRDGGVGIIGNVDLPIGTLRLADNVAWLDPRLWAASPRSKVMRQKGLTEVVSLFHPVFQAALSATGWEAFQNRKTETVKYNELGKMLEGTPGGENLFRAGIIVKERNYDDDGWNYQFDKGRFTSLVQASGLARILKNWDRLAEGVRDMNDGELAGLARYFSGLSYEEMTGQEVAMDKLEAVEKALEDEAVRRTDRRRYSGTFVPAD